MTATQIIEEIDALVAGGVQLNPEVSWIVERFRVEPELASIDLLGRTGLDVLTYIRDKAAG